jgi:hypothetical protein
VVSLIRPGGGHFTPVLGGQFGRFFHYVTATKYTANVSTNQKIDYAHQKLIK